MTSVLQPLFLLLVLVGAGWTTVHATRATFSPAVETQDPPSSSAEKPSQGESSKAESSKAESSKAESSKAESSKAESSKAESSKAESSKAESSKAESSKAESSKAESSKAESSDALGRANSTESPTPQGTRSREAARIHPPKPFDVRMPTEWSFDDELLAKATEWFIQRPAPPSGPARDRVGSWLLRSILYRHLGSPQTIDDAVEVRLTSGSSMIGSPKTLEESDAIVTLIPWSGLTPVIVRRDRIASIQNISSDQFQRAIAPELLRREAQPIERATLPRLAQSIAIGLRRDDEVRVEQLFQMWRQKGGALALAPRTREEHRVLLAIQTLGLTEADSAAAAPPLEFTAKGLEDLEAHIDRAFRELGRAKGDSEKIDALLTLSDGWSTWLARYPTKPEEVEKRNRLKSRIQLFRYDASKIHGF